jgi:hypothetical protein
MEKWRERFTYEKNELLRRELELDQRVMDKYDGVIFQVRGWEVSLWSALIVIIFQFNERPMIYVALLIPPVFWGLDAMYKTYREGYKLRRNKISAFMTSKEYENSFRKGEMKFATPVFPVHKNRNMLRNALRPHIFMLHATLLALTLVTIALIF